MMENVNAKRLAWVAPEVRELDVRETAGGNGKGGDGGTGFTDCTKS